MEAATGTKQPRLLRSLAAHLNAFPMSSTSHPINYRYKHFSLHSGVTMLCVSVTTEAVAFLEGNQHLWAIFLANAVKKHGQGKTLGVIKIGNQTYVPEPIPGTPSSEWNSFKPFTNDRPAENEEEWPADSDTATR